ncbi:MAG: hypothetical protein LKE55_03885 [Prevotella sp.]|nr:hypothetical protein [Prevotella sp.]
MSMRIVVEKAATPLQGSSLKSGDLKFVDTNHDGKISIGDKTDLGNPLPDVHDGLWL